MSDETTTPAAVADDTPVPDGMKRCKRCKQVKVADAGNFWKHNKYPDGLFSLCIPCEEARRRDNAVARRARKVRQENTPATKVPRRKDLDGPKLKDFINSLIIGVMDGSLSVQKAETVRKLVECHPKLTDFAELTELAQQSHKLLEEIQKQQSKK